MYETVIGLEVHAELATKTKLFCGCKTQFGGEPNTQCCPVCIGMPGTLPVLNQKAVEFAAAVGLATDCTITKTISFDRKNYFYPDLPKAYQISQLYLPICRNGVVEIKTHTQRKQIRIHEIHIEEDAGKLFHDPQANVTRIDYNRCGIPLIEIVSEPDLRSEEEVIAYLKKLKLILQYLGVSDCKMQEGSFRADINLSVRKLGANELGVRTEMKNMSSFKAIARAIEEEQRRQIEILENGGQIFQETRRWEEGQGVSIGMRSKEDAKDYRYFPEPDIPPVVLEDTWLKELKQRTPEMREQKQKRYETEYGLPAYDAAILTESKYLAELFEKTVALCKNPKEVSNWLMVETMRLMRETRQEPEEIRVEPDKLAALIRMLEEGRINRTVSKEVFEHIFLEQVDPEAFVRKYKLEVIKDDKMLRNMIGEVLKQNEQSVSDYRNGKEKAFGYLVGQTMKAMKGKADPEKVNQILKELLQEKK